MLEQPVDIVILTEDRYLDPNLDDWYQAQIAHEEGLVVAALAKRGLSVVRRSWSDPSMDWSQCGAAVFRSTWDYFDRFSEFEPWLEQVALKTRLINDAELIRWNIDKRYLADLERAGVAIVPTRFLACAQMTRLSDVMQEQGWDDVVFKPVVSGAARLTYRVSLADVEASEACFAHCLAGEDMMVQAFEPAIVDTGELSVIVIDGCATHAIRKTVRAGDFRVQDDHGGKVEAHVPNVAERRFAEAAVAACPLPPSYARVDFIMRREGDFRLMELELIEPELFFRFHPPAADLFAAAVKRRLI